MTILNDNSKVLSVPFNAVNWNALEDEAIKTFRDQNIMQFWTASEIPLSDDLLDWAEMSDEQKRAYVEILVSLTALDTEQTNWGMPTIMRLFDSSQRKSLCMFMGAMEGIHAESYSQIFTTLLPTEEIDALFVWAENNPFLKRKAELIGKWYAIADRNAVLGVVTKVESYMAMVASVFLESYLFYSGFFYPLYLAGQGKMTSSGEIIDLILRDESIHGLYIGLEASILYDKMTEEEQKLADELVDNLFKELHANEVSFTKSLYTRIGLEDQVLTFIKYNANKAFQQLARDVPFEDVTVESINPIVFNGLSTKTKQHDFFSKKGNGYTLALNVDKVKDEDVCFEVEPNPFGDVLELDLVG